MSKQTWRTLVLVASALVFAVPAAAATREEQRVIDATAVLDQFLNIPEQKIPPSLLSNAYAVAVVPGVKKLGFGLGARFGRGVLVVRRDDGAWSSPAFVALSGGSVGWQLGIQSTDVILVFKNKNGVAGISSGKLTLGADASVAAGPVGRQASAATDVYGEAEVVSYSRNRGLFAGVAFEGSGVTMDKNANAAFYGDPTLTPEMILERSPSQAPAAAGAFTAMLSQGALPVSQAATEFTAPSVESDTSSSEGVEGPDDVRTYGIPDPDDPHPED